MTHSDRKALILGSVLMATIVAAGRVWPALSSAESSRLESARAAIQTLSTLDGSLRLLPAMQDTIIARRRRRAGVDSLLIAGASAAAAGASLIGYVNSVAEECGIKLLSTSVRVDSARRGLSRVTVRISTVTDGQGVGELVSELETGAPMIAVREMTITGTDAGAPPTRAEALRLDLLLEGLAQIGEKAGAAAVAHLRAVAEKTP